MKFYENCIELSDEHICWKLSNFYISSEDFEPIYNVLINNCQAEFKSIYGIDFYMLGRSGRHICVENTPLNRKNYSRMKSTINRLQSELVNTFNNFI